MSISKRVKQNKPSSLLASKSRATLWPGQGGCGFAQRAPASRKATQAVLPTSQLLHPTTNDPAYGAAPDEQNRNSIQSGPAQCIVVEFCVLQLPSTHQSPSLRASLHNSKPEKPTRQPRRPSPTWTCPFCCWGATQSRRNLNCGPAPAWWACPPLPSIPQRSLVG